MPYYDYQCQDCKTDIEVKASISEKDQGLEVSCPECSSKNTAQVYKSPAFIGSSASSGSAPSGGSCGEGCGCFMNN